MSSLFRSLERKLDALLFEETKKWDKTVRISDRGNTLKQIGLGYQDMDNGQGSKKGLWKPHRFCAVLSSRDRGSLVFILLLWPKASLYVTI